MNKNLTRDLQLNHDFALGVTKSELARQFNLSRQRVGQIINRYNDVKDKEVFNQERIDAVNQLRIEYGISFQDVANEIGCSAHTVKSHLYNPKNTGDNAKMRTVTAINKIIRKRLNITSAILERLIDMT